VLKAFSKVSSLESKNTGQSESWKHGPPDDILDAVLYRKPSVGQQTSAYCGRCKLERTHTIAAMEPDGTIKKVSCTMCGSYHNYSRNSKTSNQNGGSKADGGTRKSRSTRPVQDLSRSGRPARPYQMSACFMEGDLINHPKFGLGCVETIKPPNKIEVRFQEGKKILLHNTAALP